MAITVSTTWSSGVVGNKGVQSCVGVAGSGLPSAFFGCHGSIEVRQNDDGTVDMRATGFHCEQAHMSNANTDGTWGDDTWTFHGLYLSRSAFTLYDGPGGPSGYGSGAKVWTGGHMNHENYGSGNPSDHSVWLASGGSTEWQRIANSVNELEHSDTEIYVYLGGLVDFTAAATSSISINAARVALTSAGDPPIADLFEYYPWERRLSNAWHSLNRSGGSLTRREGGAWVDVKNSSGGRAEGFRYNNGWQKSPKSGIGA